MYPLYEKTSNTLRSEPVVWTLIEFTATASYCYSRYSYSYYFFQLPWIEMNDFGDRLNKYRQILGEFLRN